jgi:hypothetical protein
MTTISGLVFLASSCSIALASKASTLYPNGVTNPNVDNAMYWEDSKNVLQDLSQFDKLYVQYNGCTWSPYFEAADGDDGGDNICSGYAGGTDDGGTGWYLGMAGCSRAQVAYSLYGTLKGQKDKGCRKSRFINSFFTFGGVEAWISSMQSLGALQDFSTSSNGDEDRRLDYDEYTIASTCTTVGGDDRNLEEDNGEENGDSFNEGATSIGVGCTTAGNFRLYEFQGSYCHADSSAQTVDTLNAFNSAIEGQTCVQIYDGSSYTYNEEDEEDGDQDDAASPLTVLAQSKSCSPQWSTNCPDPYGKVAQYETAMARAFLNEEECAALDKKEIVFKSITIFFFFAGTLLLSLAYLFNNPSQQRKVRPVIENTKSVDSTTTDATFFATGVEQNEDVESEAESEQKELKDDVNEDTYVEMPLEMPEAAPSQPKYQPPKQSVDDVNKDTYVEMSFDEMPLEMPEAAASQPKYQPPKQSVDDVNGDTYVKMSLEETPLEVPWAAPSKPKYQPPEQSVDDVNRDEETPLEIPGAAPSQPKYQPQRQSADDVNRDEETPLEIPGAARSQPKSEPPKQSVDDVIKDAYVEMPLEDMPLEMPEATPSQPKSEPPKESVSKTTPTRLNPTWTRTARIARIKSKNTGLSSHVKVKSDSQVEV